MLQPIFFFCFLQLMSSISSNSQIREITYINEVLITDTVKLYPHKMIVLNPSGSLYGNHAKMVIVDLMNLKLNLPTSHNLSRFKIAWIGSQAHLTICLLTNNFEIY